MAYGDGSNSKGQIDPELKKQQAAAAASAAQVKDLQNQLTLRDLQSQANQYTGPGYAAPIQGTQERAAGVLPPGFQGMTDVHTGQLLDQYRVNPFAGAASKKLQQEALGAGPSEWAQNALAKQQSEQALQSGAAGLQQQTAQSNAMSQLARMGGVGGGARTSLARSGARDALMAQQGVNQQGAASRYAINDQDTQRKQQLLGQTADVERAGDVQNLNTTMANLSAKAQFDANRYNQQMSAWAAKQSADATRAAGGGGGGGKK